MRAEKLIVVAILFIACSSNAHAYIDPGTGSVITTAVLGFFAAIAYTFRKYMYRLKDLLSSKKSAEPEPEKCVEE
ncbi:MAG: hypothetical protein RIC56_19150 [Pseudomonadales bacterium]